MDIDHEAHKHDVPTSTVKGEKERAEAEDVSDDIQDVLDEARDVLDPEKDPAQKPKQRRRKAHDPAPHEGALGD
jgi:hypothetical protein